MILEKKRPRGKLDKGQRETITTQPIMRAEKTGGNFKSK